MRKTALIAFALLAVTAIAEDSPLVALAKRSHRAESKTPVITNDTLIKSGRASFATGDPANAPTLPPAQSAPAPAASAPSPATPVAQPRFNYPAPGADAQQATSSSVRNIDPTQSTVRYIEPQSTVRNIDTAVTVRNIDPQSTANNIDPQSTARTIEPVSTNHQQ